MKLKKRLKTIVCGSRFGQFYIEALNLLKEDFEIVGLLAKGSERSISCAKEYGIKLYTDIKELPTDIDLACVVVKSGVIGGNGTELTLEFLSKGINVILEQPVHYNDITKCMKVARKNNVCFHIGDLYVNLPSVKKFSLYSKAILKEQKGLYIDLSCTTQVSFPLVHILLKILSSTRPLKINDNIEKVGILKILTGKIGDIPILIKADNRLDPENPDNCLPLLHEINIGFEGGRISLIETHGFIVWSPCLYVPEVNGIPNKFKDKCPLNLIDNSSEILGGITENSFKDILTKEWPVAIGKDLIFIKDMILKDIKKEVLNKNGQQNLLCSKYWHEITKKLGYPSIKNNDDYKHISINNLQQIIVND
ncbi:Gfo/Idh/MocA family oxidoreductase [Clostridium senegalense]|uniref:Gfo/Idh/MocA family oxidoreductase n=1 Tax=Clostridium senegalense TaxID=1465809 RepID=UPI001C0F64AA|nr:Gfo/Idh/MocA family oxidoreductase [Clostridium senegalense]MBU5228211.1 Gfo/Idh/MocA family oxidoreductase [Clostridium senegalense]